MRHHGPGRDRPVGRLNRAAILAAPLLVAAWLGGCKDENKFAAPPPPKVGVAHPVQQPVLNYLEGTGNTVAVNQIDLVARVKGFLSAINYQDGAAAKTGQTLFVIEQAPYQAQLQQAQAALSSPRRNWCSRRPSSSGSRPCCARTSPRSPRWIRRAPSGTATRAT